MLLENGRACDPAIGAAAGENSESEVERRAVIALKREIPIELRYVGQDPSGTIQNQPSWLAEVREMRGRACYDDGHRPSFRKTDGSFEDADLVDFPLTMLSAARTGELSDACESHR